MLTIIPTKRALTLARNHAPIAYCGFQHYYDFPVEIKLGGDPRAQFPEAMTTDPVAYYWARTDGKDWYYIGFAFFHAMDWAPFPASVLPGEVHRYDFEGILCRVPYYLPHHQPKEMDAVLTVFHHEFKSWRTKGTEIVRICIGIQPEGHGIENIRPVLGKNHLCVHDWAFLPLDPIMNNPKHREVIRQEFNNNGVNLPDQWAHEGKYKGWFWNNPAMLFKMMFGEV